MAKTRYGNQCTAATAYSLTNSRSCLVEQLLKDWYIGTEQTDHTLRQLWRRLISHSASRPHMSEHMANHEYTRLIYTHLDAENRTNSKHKTSATESIQQSKWKMKALKRKEHLLTHTGGSDSFKSLQDFRFCHLLAYILHRGFVTTHTPHKPGTEQVQALADISHLALCCHSNVTHAPIANLPNSAQLEGTPYHSPKLHPGLCSSVGMRQRTDRHTDRQTDR